MQISDHDVRNGYGTVMMISMTIEEARKEAKVTLERVESVFMSLIFCHNSKDGDNESKGNIGSGKKDTGCMVNRDRDRGKGEGEGEGKNKGGNEGNSRENGKGVPEFLIAKQWT